MKIFKKIIWKFLNLLNLDSYVVLGININFLKSKGWFLSFKNKKSIDKFGKPIPWFSYPIISFLENRLNKNMTVFEYGCGNSTLWFAQKVKSIVSVEHHLEWFNEIKNSLPKNAKLVFQELHYGGKYSEQVLLENKKFKIIIIDGRDRINCIKKSVNALASDGVIIFDNSQLSDYIEGINFLKKCKFKRIDFWGQIPIAAYENCTTIFYKSNNCIGI